MDTYSTIKKYLFKSLKDLYPSSEIDHIFFLILFKVMKWKKIDFILNKHEIPEEELLNYLNQVIPKLKQNIPIQHILGFVSFYDLELKVNKDVLIPRPETEELVYKVISELSFTDKSLLDIGTGSGCIPLAVKNKCPELVCVGIDVSALAIAVAKENADSLGLEVDFVQQDVFSLPFISTVVDVIVSNPPYIPKMEIDSMSPNVLDYEPHSALFVEDDNPLLFYQQIAKIGRDILNKNGKIYFEIHENFGDQVVNLLTNLNYSNISLCKDLQGKDRIVKASK